MSLISRYSLTCEMFFDAAHRLSNYEGKCKRIHGHTYKVIVEISANSLNDWGAIMDFGDLKKMMNTYIDEVYDHKLLLFDKDPVNEQISETLPTDGGVYWMTANPTAENIAADIYASLKAIIKDDTYLEKVTVYETPTNAASYTEK